MPALRSQGASTPQEIAPPTSTLMPARGPIIAPVDASNGLQFMPRVRLATATPAIVPPNAVACGISFGVPSRNQVIANAATAVPASSFARRIAAARVV